MIQKNCVTHVSSTFMCVCVCVCMHEQMKTELDRRAEKRTRLLSWIGLGLMGTQFGFMARLTWWEYSWDIMEPVTYFVGYGTTIAMFAYYVITRQVLVDVVKESRLVMAFCKNSFLAC